MSTNNTKVNCCENNICDKTACEKMTDSDIKIESDDLMARGEWFRSFDENFLPMELDTLSNSYHLLIEKLGRKCHSAVKYHNLCEKYRKQLKHEMDEMNRMSHEIKEFERMWSHQLKVIKKSMKCIDEYNQTFIDNIIALHEGPRDIMLAFQGFLHLGPEGTQGGSDISWDCVKTILKDRTKLAHMMKHMSEKRIKHVSKDEMDKAAECMRHFTHEFSSHDNNTSHMLSRAMAAFVMCCLCIWDLHESIRARRELMIVKKQKFDVMKREMSTYETVTGVFEREVDAAISKYHHAKTEYDGLKKEAMKADLAMKSFETHFQEMERERNAEHKDLARIEGLLKDLEKDCADFDTIKVRSSYNKVLSDLTQF